MKGLLLVDKPLDYTSHDVVDIVRNLEGVNKAGHIGTLDPTASGLLGVLINKATKISQFLIGLDKKYKITAKLGKQTDTLDQAGEVIKTCPTERITEEKIREAMASFEGEIEQKPPKYSAIKKDGKKLYEYAREQQEVEIPTRKITIKRIELENFDQKSKTLKLNISCSSGTYTRSLIRDIGRKLDSCAYQTKLRRYAIDDYKLHQAISLAEIKQKDKIQAVETSLIEINQALHFFPKIELKDEAVKFAKQGTTLRPKNFTEIPDFTAGATVRICNNSQLLAVGEVITNPSTAEQEEEVMSYKTVLV
jgi:tRNA pseudouridine55 synthase